MPCCKELTWEAPVLHAPQVSSLQLTKRTKSKPAVYHGGTFSANPLSITAGLAALQSNTKDAVAQMGDTIRSEIM